MITIDAEPVNDKKRMVAILPYTKMPDTDEITFQKGDIFFVHNDLGDGWLWVTAHRSHLTPATSAALLRCLQDRGAGTSLQGPSL